MAHKLAYVAQPSLLPKIFEKVKTAKTPDRFTQDFLSTVLGFKGGNYRQFIPLAKKLKLLNTDGTPTNLYKQFRNNSTSEAAMAQAMKNGYTELFERNEFAYKLSDSDLKGLVVEITGLENKDRVVQLICQTFKLLNSMADFNKSLETSSSGEEEEVPDESTTNNLRDFDMNLSYTINLVLPKTDDPAIYNAIFKSLKENLLRK